MQALFTDEHAAPLRVAASFTIGEYLLPSLVSQWTQLHPKSQIHLRIGNTSEVIAAVAALDVDIGFVEGSQTHADLVVRPWLDDEMVILAAPGHPLANRCATARQLADATWVLREHGSGTRQIADEWLLKNLDRVRVGFELGSTEAIKRVVAASDALGCLSLRGGAKRGRRAPGRTANTPAQGKPQARHRAAPRKAAGPRDHRLPGALQRRRATRRWLRCGHRFIPLAPCPGFTQSAGACAAAATRLRP
ncbi:LysR substrate-binding domain-containing protein [Polaromonas sp. P2-4]|nr:LysR substrate-binding domain-containing protein [Polaromonas sp. P2-4]